MREKDIESLQHTTWRCQYHVVFAPKYRRMAIYGQIKKDIGQILRMLCDYKHVEIIEGHAMPGPHSYARIDSAEIGGSRFYGILERQEYVDDF